MKKKPRKKSSYAACKYNPDDFHTHLSCKLQKKENINPLSMIEMWTCVLWKAKAHMQSRRRWDENLSPHSPLWSINTTRKKYIRSWTNNDERLLCLRLYIFFSVFRCGVLLKTIENEMFKSAITKKRRDKILNNETERILYEMLKKKLIHYTLLLWLNRTLFTRQLIEINLP